MPQLSSLILIGGNMNSLKHRAKRIITSNRSGLLIFSLLAVSTVAAVSFADRTPPQTPNTPPAPTTASSGNGSVTLSASLSQTKLVQGDDGLVYLELAIESPAKEAQASRRKATDVVVVLDRSGSMAEDNKLPFAKEAIRSLLSSLNSEDRFSLIAFDDRAQVFSPLVYINDTERQRLHKLVSDIYPGSSTNIGDGLLRAKTILEGSARERTRKVLLLSDGQVNMGITDPKQLASLASSFGIHEAVLSTVGMGLGFNELLLSSLADQGMGNYSYLESLHGLDNILAKELNDTRNIYARASSISFDVPADVQVLDAAGYPFDASGYGAKHVSIRSGQLSSNSRKALIATLKFPTAKLGQSSISNISLDYEDAEGQHRITLDSSPVVVAVLPPEMRTQSIASINQALYQKSWQANNSSRMKGLFSSYLRAGDRVNASRAIADYKDSLSKAQVNANAPLMSKELKKELSEMESDLSSAFSGSAAAQAENQNRAAKSYHFEALKGQRGY
jgi:Ca-activated chloride channel family protein